MSQSEIDTKKEQMPEVEDHSSLKGTLIFVMSIGTFILVTWFAIFFLYLSRI